MWHVGDRRKMMPIGNISSRNFWRVRGQKTTAQVINSGGEAESANRASSLHPATTTIAGASGSACWWQREEERFFSMLFFLGMGGGGGGCGAQQQQAEN